MDAYLTLVPKYVECTVMRRRVRCAEARGVRADVGRGEDDVDARRI